MKKLHPAVNPICLYCEHARKEREDNTMSSFRDVLPCEKESALLCRYHGKVEAGDTCLRFRFDPLKYLPKKAPPIATLSEEDIIS